VALSGFALTSLTTVNWLQVKLLLRSKRFSSVTKCVHPSCGSGTASVSKSNVGTVASHPVVEEVVKGT